MIVVVTGGRDFADADLVDVTLAEHVRETGIATLYHGGARGLDTLAAQWAVAHGIPVCEVVADWRLLGRMAGPERNLRMLETAAAHAKRIGNICLCIAFPGGKGTANCILTARSHNVPVAFAAPMALDR